MAEYKKFTGDNECVTDALLRERMKELRQDVFLN